MAQRGNASKNRIKAQAASGTLSHAWLVTGGSAANREDLAAYIAAALICPAAEAPCGECIHCVKLARGIHPDLIRLEKLPDKSAYVVEQVRDMLKDAYVMPNEAPRKVYLIPAVDEMNVSAQNAMLKMLEEPPARSAFVMIATNSSAVLNTVRSRCVEIAADGEDGAGGEDKYARAIFDSFVRCSELDIAAACFMLEKAKLDRAGFDSALEALSMLFGNEICSTQTVEAREQLFEAKKAVDELLRRRNSNNTGAGHTAGALAVKLAGVSRVSKKLNISF